MDSVNKLLMIAAKRGDLAGVQAALDAGADVHESDDFALHLAAAKGYLDIVHHLLSVGANLHTVRDLAVRFAAEHHQTATVRMLLKHGAHWQALLPKLPEYTPAIQVVFLSFAPAHELSLTELCQQGVCPEGLCALLTHQGHAELAAMLMATHLLDPLDPDARALLLVDILDRNPGFEVTHDRA